MVYSRERAKSKIEIRNAAERCQRSRPTFLNRKHARSATSCPGRHAGNRIFSRFSSPRIGNDSAQEERLQDR
jgi:hypothetical protein